MVPVYRPVTAEAGTAIATVGCQVAELLPTPTVPATTVCAVPDSVTVGMGVATITPVGVTMPVA